jgi:hypothetical protein
MSEPKPESVAGKAVADHGVVLLDGPDGVAVAMTPDCAEGTARELLAAAAAANRQRRDGD